jgi:signal peptidase I
VFIGGLATAVATTHTYSVPSTSMEPTVRPGDTIVVDTTAHVRRGDVIVESQPSTAPGVLVRRVIGLPGDHVACCDAQGRITVNGTALDETYLYAGDKPSPGRFSVTVPAGRFWLLGDHRSIADDSHVQGALPVRIIGRVTLVERSGDSILLRTPPTFIAGGLATAASTMPPGVVAVIVAACALVLLIVLTVIGIIRFALRRRAAPAPPVPAGFA